MADQSEGSVVMAACMAAIVATSGLVAGRQQPAGEHGAGHATHGAPAVERGDERAPAGPTNVARGDKGAVSAAAPEASEAGLAVLREGGTAADALIAASFVVCVVRPQSTGIGGGGFAIYHDAASGHDLVLDGRERAPADAKPSMFLGANGEPDAALSRRGAKAAGIPGLVALMADLHRAHGKLAWARLLQPAIDLAEKGFPVTELLARRIRENVALLSNGDAADLYLRGGSPLRAGDILVQRDLAETLKEIQRLGAPGFYQGKVAERIAQSQRNGGGLITQQDLLDYKVVAREPVVGSYHGYKVISMPPPSAGGALLVEMLNVLGPMNVRALGWQSPAHVHALAETMRRAYADRSEHLGDPDQVRVPVAWLTGAARADAIRAEVQAAERATPSSAVRAGKAPNDEGGNTTHVSVVDADGNACSSTHTINTAFGSGVIVAGTGVLLNDEMDDFAAKAGAANAYGLVQGTKNLPAPGKRPLSSMTPTIVLDDHGKVALVLGSPGGSQIITSVLQVLSNVVDFDMPLERAVSAPRVHHQWLPDELVVEDGVARGTVEALAARGHRVVIEGKHLGEVQAVQVDPRGGKVAVTDARGDGSPRAY